MSAVGGKRKRLRIGDGDALSAEAVDAPQAEQRADGCQEEAEKEEEKERSPGPQ